ncbi:DNA degradation protein EddB [Chromobacterium sp. ATCC 53434]|uniref:ExeM/NucH family extracellular endonuclease n=1 Tax=Chromobacterium TaxID=535 RepID=UPI000C779F30|nr:ExeM/NucH family extracellular endonuclease [Chromobacterium sp. ATCC 53434]AUH49749.1 DNA degradation protein EddB [Chromobacterium sp. ATCC 53434]
MRTIPVSTLSRAVAAASLALAGLQAHAACSLPDTRIHQIQGNGPQSPMQGKTVTVQGVVSGLLYGKDGPAGFFIQEAQQNQDADPATSEGIYVYTGKLALPPLKAGDVVGVRGKVLEFGRKGDASSETQLQPSAAADVQACGYQGELAPVTLRLPLSDAAAAQLESLTGMAVKFEQPLFVVDSYNYGRYGELTLSSQPRQWVPTQQHRPGSAEAQALRASNTRDRLLLDDGKTWQNADAWLPGPGGLSAANTLRVGDRLDGLVGVVSFSNGAYRVQPLSQPQVAASNPRAAAPARKAGQLRVASFNVLNFFNGDGKGGGFPTERGARTRDDFLRQKAKIVSAIRQLDADVLGLMELENDGFGPQSAVKELVDALNAGVEADKQYRFVDPGLPKIGTDAITTGMLYRPSRVKPDGAAQALAIGDPGKNRLSLAQTFDIDGKKLTLVVNHLKSKGSSCAQDKVGGVPDVDTGDGQGNCNLTRVQAARDLVSWAKQRGASAKEGLLVIGDMNAYAKEDPIRAFEDGGLSNLLARFRKDAYSYVYQGESGNLDHALADATLTKWVAGAGEWHINADEPTALEYGSEFKSASQRDNYYAPDAYRSSDHDPLYVDLQPVPVAGVDEAALAMLGLAGLLAWRRRR